MKRAIKTTAMAVAISFIASGAFASTPGITADTITFGQSAALDGPAGALGRGMKLGLNAAFKEANDTGGVHGRMLEITSYGDGYEPDRAIDNTNKLIDDDNVFALIGAVGTPTPSQALRAI